MVPIYRGGEPRVTRAGPGQVLLWGAVLGLGRAVGHLEDEGGWSLQMLLGAAQAPDSC